MPGVSAAALGPSSPQLELHVSLCCFIYRRPSGPTQRGQSPSLLRATGSFQDGRLGDGGLWQEAVQTVRSA